MVRVAVATSVSSKDMPAIADTGRPAQVRVQTSLEDFLVDNREEGKSEEEGSSEYEYESEEEEEEVPA